MVMVDDRGRQSAVMTRTQRRRPVVGLDCDGVLYRWGMAARAALFARYGLEISEEIWFNEQHCTPEQWQWLWSDVGVDEVFGGGHAFRGAVKFTRRLHRIADIRIITAIPENARAPRERWLRSRGIPFDSLAFVTPPVHNDGLQSAFKSTVLPHCDVYVDDNVGNCLDLADNTPARAVVLVDHSWNRGPEYDEALALRPQVVRARTWDDVLDVVKSW